jgi:hypothetical protein
MAKRWAAEPVHPKMSRHLHTSGFLCMGNLSSLYGSDRSSIFSAENPVLLALAPVTRALIGPHGRTFQTDFEKCTNVGAQLVSMPKPFRPFRAFLIAAGLRGTRE